ncbi:MAG: M3 family metallopeptidase [Salinivirgaceae bacterium]|nr:M3 family metallopeptidase [Salinivirgaceae bacterium]
MKLPALTLLIVGLFTFSCSTKTENQSTIKNPLLLDYNTPFEAPPFNEILPEHFMPAFEEGMKQQNELIENLIENYDEPSFENTIEAYENSNELLNKIENIFDNIKSAATTDEIQSISIDLAPLMSAHNDDIKLNEKLFAKINDVYNRIDNLTLSVEQKTLLTRTYQNFVRGGSLLKMDNRDRFKEINKKLSLLYLQFGDNVLAENNRFKLVIDNINDLEGLTQNSINAAAMKANELDLAGKWVFTIQKPSLLPFLENSKNRDLREKMYKAYILKGDHNDSLDNKNIIEQIVHLRIERAQLLGYQNYAEYVLEMNMAKNPENVYDLLEKLMTPALKVAQKEVDDMQKIINQEGGDFTLEAWDYPYYAAKVKEEKYALNENDIRPYLKLENTRDGMFWVANQLYGITFTKLENMPIYHPEVEVFEVKESTGDHIGVLYLDYHPRESKQSGAWCTSFCSQKYKNGKRVPPISSIVCNFSAPVGDTPALLTVDETETLFHEFGHALDGLFSNKHYSSLRTPRDFVELPSQIMENWAFAPEVLKQYATHYKTGEPMPAELIDKIANASKFNQGFATTEYLAASFLDMDFHTLNKVEPIDINSFEKQSMKRIQLISEIDPRYRSTYFQHIFSSSSYSSGYYSYMWAEVLDADAFEVFMRNGIFDKTTAASFRSNILELGGTEDAMTLYRRFRGDNPDIQALIKRKGLN